MSAPTSNTAPAKVSSSTSANTAKPFCPRCRAALKADKDVFCRTCGARVLVACSKCGSNVLVDDTFCNACGARRWYWLELLRTGIWHQVRAAARLILEGGLLQDRTLNGLAILGVAGAWFTLFFALRKRINK